MKRNKMFFMIFTFVFTLLFTQDVFAFDLAKGTYTSFDGRSFTVNEDNTIKYENTYKLKVNATANTLSGSIGTDKKAITFYLLNNSSVFTKAAMTYTYNGVSSYVYEYTGFKANVTPVVDANGIFEVWSNGSKVNTYADLQSAVDAAGDNDVVKVTENFVADSGVLINKKVTIDGMNHTIDRSNWNYGLFVVCDDGELNLKNITIDGGADGFEVDYDSVTFNDYYIPLKAGSLDSDPKLTLSAILVRGKLNTDNVTVKNNFTASNGGAMIVADGNVKLENSTFEHNFGHALGGAIYVGSVFRDRTTYPVESVTINNCEFKDNYVANSNNLAKFSVGHGGAVYVVNTEKVDINDSKFTDNVAYYGKGGAVTFADQSTSNIIAETLGLPYIQASIKNSEFYNNWAGNDGFAIQSYAADLYLDGCTFRKNVGAHPTGSVGTVSIEAYRESQRIYSSINNCTFEENTGPCSGIGDHASYSDIDLTNTEFKGNVGNETLLFYTSVSNIEDCKFIGEVVAQAVIDARSYENYTIPPSMTLKNVDIEDTEGPTDILVRKNTHNASLNDYTIILKGDNTSNINLWDGNDLKVEGNFSGDISCDNTTKEENITVNDNAVVDGKITYVEENELTVILNFEVETGRFTNIFLHLEKDKVYSKEELYLMHSLEKNGHKIAYYTDKGYTTPWTMSVSDHTTIYGRWEVHDHTYNTEYKTLDNVIYEYCDCGHLGKKLALDVNDNSNKKVNIINELGIKDSDYILSYKKLNNGIWEDYVGVPNNTGTYKAVLTHKSLVIEKEYSILTVPNTIDSLGSFIVMFISALVGIGVTLGVFIKVRKKI